MALEPVARRGDAAPTLGQGGAAGKIGRAERLDNAIAESDGPIAALKMSDADNTMERPFMTIDWAHFTPGTALAGGALIGLAAALLFHVNGRMLGASGLLAGLLSPVAAERSWRATALLGLVLAPFVARALFATPAPTIAAGPAALIAGGLLVGFGTRLANGCTSGHGVCGLARLSPRSLAAVLVFMAAGFATVFVVRHGV